MKYRRKNKVGDGRIATKTREILEANGYRVTYLDTASGFWARQDVYRWEVSGKDPGGLTFTAGCWQTMTDFCRLATKFGFCFKDGELWANEEVK